MIFQRYLARILQESLASEKIRARILQEWSSRASPKNYWKSLARTFQDLAFLALFAKFFFAIFCKNDALSCKKLQETSKNLASFVRQNNPGVFEDWFVKVNTIKLQMKFFSKTELNLRI